MEIKQVYPEYWKAFPFKSHYVVWKFYILIPLWISGALFKSHYVVWKYTPENIQMMEEASLNRTM